MVNTSAEVRTGTVSGLLYIRPLRLNVDVRFIRVKRTRYRVDVYGGLGNLYFNRTRRRHISVLLGDAFLRRFYGNIYYLRRPDILRINASGGTAQVRIIMRNFTLARRLQTRGSVIAIRLLAGAYDMAGEGHALSGRGNFQIMFGGRFGSDFRYEDIGRVLLTVMVYEDHGRRRIHVEVYFFDVRDYTRIRLFLYRVLFGMLILGQ